MNYTVEEYTSEWNLKFQIIKKLLEKIFTQSLKIEHVGSTAIPGMKAKPVIDVLVEVADIHSLETEKSEMKKAGYEIQENIISPNSLLFFKTINNQKIENIHVIQSGEKKISDLLNMRDYFKTHPDKVKEYEELKISLQAQFPDNYVAYREGKYKFLEKLQELANQWKAKMI